MLIQFSVENHRAIRKRQTFSMVAAGADVIDRLEPPYHAVETGLASVPRVLVDACLLGANGSGKTCLVDAMAFMVDFVRNSVEGGPSGEIDVKPFVFHSKWRKRPSEFELIFVHCDVIYKYGFVATDKRVMEEWLFVGNDKTDRWRRIFEREYDPKRDGYEWRTTGLKANRVLVSWKNQTRPDALFLGTAVRSNAGGDLKRAYEWMATKFKTFSAAGGEAGYKYTAGRFGEEGWKGRVQNFLEDSGVLLNDIAVQKVNVREMPGFASLPGVVKNAIKNEALDGTKTVHFCRNDEKGDLVVSGLDKEGRGARALFGLAGLILDAIDNGDTIVIDELNLGLHPLVLESLVGRFCDRENNTKKAQMIFTTNDPTIVSNALLERDQIWIVDKKKNTAGARFERLPKLKGRHIKHFLDDYMAGNFGGVPEIRRTI